MKPTLRLASANNPPPRDPNRAALAAAISQASNAEQMVNAARAAVARAREMVEQAQGRLDTAMAAVGSAKAEQAVRIATAATSGAPMTSDSSTRAARAKEQEALDDVEAARAALATVKETADEADYALGKASERVEVAARAVMALEIGRAVANLDRLEGELYRARNAVWALHNRCFSGVADDESRRVEHSLSFRPYNLGPNEPGAGVWLAYFAALKSDPDARAPDVAADQ